LPIRLNPESCYYSTHSCHWQRVTIKSLSKLDIAASFKQGGFYFINLKKVIKMIFRKKTIPLLPWAGKESIYEFIINHIDAFGKLASDFDDLPDSQEYFQGQKIRWVGGAMDSLLGGNSKDAGQIARRFYKLLRKQVSNPSNINRRATYLFAMHNEVIGYVDSLLEMIRREFCFNSQAFMDEAIWLATRSAHRNPVKLGIALMGVFHCDAHLKVLNTLGFHDEFTLFVAVAIQNGVEDCNQCLFELAQHIDGWGKINLIQRLEPDTEEIQEWLLIKGCQNNIMNEYLAYTCAVKGDLNKALGQDNIKPSLFKGAGVIIDALINGGPAEDIDDYRQSMSVVTNYLRHAKQLTFDLDDFLVIANIKAYLEQTPEQWSKRWEVGWNEEIRTESLKECIEILERKTWSKLIWDHLVSKDSYQHYQAVQAGRILKLDIWPILFEQLKADPVCDNLYFDVMKTSDPERILQVVQFAEKALPLSEIASGPQDEMALGMEYQAHHCLDFIIQELDHYEGIGKRLIAAALWSSSIRNRNMALRVLKAWKSENWPEDAKEILMRLQTMESDEDIKREVNQLLKEYPSV
jgi:hypothetical protein